MQTVNDWMIKMKINLGSGYDNRSDCLNIDNNVRTLPDILLDVDTEILPFNDGSVDEVLAYNILEHLINLEEVLEDIHAVMKKGAVLKIIVPYKDSQLALNHVREFDENCFKGWDKQWYESKEGIGKHQYKFNFKTIKIEVRGHWLGRLINNHTWHSFWRSLLTEIYVEMVKI